MSSSMMIDMGDWVREEEGVFGCEGGCLGETGGVWVWGGGGGLSVGCL